MSNTITIKRNSSSGNNPSASDLTTGELAVNTADAKLFVKHSDGSIKDITVVESLTTARTKAEDYKSPWGSSSSPITFTVKVATKTAGWQRIRNMLVRASGATACMSVLARGWHKT